MPGDRIRISQPDGASKNTRPMAIALCGTATNAASVRRNNENLRSCISPVKMIKQQSKDKIVATNPVFSASQIDAPTPGAVMKDMAG